MNFAVKICFFDNRSIEYLGKLMTTNNFLLFIACPTSW